MDRETQGAEGKRAGTMAARGVGISRAAYDVTAGECKGLQRGAAEDRSHPNNGEDLSDT
jgi:hypothetical protein